MVQEKKPLEAFHQLCPQSRARSVTLPVILGRMNFAQYKKAVGTFSRVRVEGHALYITGTIVAIALYVNGLQILHSTKS